MTWKDLEEHGIAIADTQAFRNLWFAYDYDLWSWERKIGAGTDPLRDGWGCYLMRKNKPALAAKLFCRATNTFCCRTSRVLVKCEVSKAKLKLQKSSAMLCLWGLSHRSLSILSLKPQAYWLCVPLIATFEVAWPVLESASCKVSGFTSKK